MSARERKGSILSSKTLSPCDSFEYSEMKKTENGMFSKPLAVMSWSASEAHRERTACTADCLLESVA